MCVVSNTGDYFRDTFPREYPWINPVPAPFTTTTITLPPEITRKEFDELKSKIDGMIELLKAAQKYDREHGQPDCEVDEKMEFLKKIAALVGIDLYKEMKFKKKKKTTKQRSKRKLLNESKKA
jgi:hypothetical protein